MTDAETAYRHPKGTTECPTCGNDEGLLLQVKQPSLEVECVMCRTWPVGGNADESAS